MTVRQALRPLAAAPLLALVVLGCQEPGSTPTDPATVLDNRAREELPFHLEGDAVLVDLQRDPSGNRSTFDGRCSEPADAVMRFAVEGHATYLGQTTGLVEHCTQFVPNTGTAYKITDGVTTFTAANGDELRGEHERLPGTSGEEIEWVGGTGLFATAWGTATALAVCNQAAGTCMLAIDGTLSFAPGL